MTFPQDWNSDNDPADEGQGNSGGYGYPPVGGNPPYGSYPPPPPGSYPPPGGYPPPYQQPMTPETNSMAIASLVVSLLCCGPVGLVLGLVALNQITASGEGGRGLALAGTILGGISTVFAFLVLISGGF